MSSQALELPLDPVPVAVVLDRVEGGADAGEVLPRRRDRRVVAGEVEREARQARAGSGEERGHLSLGHRDHRLLGRDPVADPAGTVAVRAQQLDPRPQVPRQHAVLEQAGTSQTARD